MIAFLWNEGKRRGGGKERWVNPHTYSKSLSSRITALLGNLSPQESTQDPSLAQLLPLLIARRQLAEAALNRAAAPCSHLSGQHHPWLMQPSWKSFIVQQLLTALSWEMQPSASLWSALWHLGAEVGLAAVPPVHREALGWGEKPALKYSMGCEAQGRAGGDGRSTKDELHGIQRLAAAATSNISYCIPISSCLAKWPSAVVLHPQVASGHPECCHRPPSALGTTSIQHLGNPPAL